jgi:anaerobic selenocysteine-containing dehydrogenase
MKVTRREFLKATTAIGATAAMGGCVASRKSNLTEMELAGSEREMTVISDVDGHSQCRMMVSVEDGEVTGVSSDPNDPEGRGELTLRGRHARDILYAPDRLKHPMKRVGQKGEGKWERISWDEALNTIASNLVKAKEEYGAEAIDFHYGHYHSGDISSYLARLAHLIGTPNISTPNHVCHIPRVFLEFYFDYGSVASPDTANTDCIIIWGGNPRNTNKPQSIAIREARERGAKLIVIDPRATSCAEEADIHAQLRPGTDGALALGMLNI